MESGELVADRYRLEERIGAGSMGTVWLATDTTLRRIVALKLGSESRREGVGGARLMHPNVIAVFDVTRDGDGRDWLVMEYLPSRSLNKIRSEDGPMPPADVARIGAQIAAALAHLHAKGMVHRDVTPANVLVTPDLIAKLTDFGIATWDSETQTSDPKTGGGTPGFQAPEVVRGNRATPPSDIYSLGATLLTSVEGHPSPDANRDAPLGTVLADLMHPDPERRPTAEQAQRRLSDLAGMKSRHRARWLVVAAAVVVVVVAAAVLWSVHPFASRANTPGPASIMGDPHTADPCALTFANALADYGTVETTNDYGNFNRCDALVHLPQNQQDFVDVHVEFDIHQQVAGVPVQQQGAIGIQRPPADPDTCGRVLLLSHDYQVSIYANEHGHEKLDLCGMADAVTASALVALNAGPIPRRTLPAASLANKDACALLDTATVTSVFAPGLVRQPQFGNWECDWSDPHGPGMVQVIFDQTTAGSDETTQGTPLRLAGYDAHMEPGGDTDTGCVVALIYRTYTDSKGEATDDVVEINLDDSDRQPAQLCAPVQRLATTVAKRLSH